MLLLACTEAAFVWIAALAPPVLLVAAAVMMMMDAHATTNVVAGEAGGDVNVVDQQPELLLPQVSGTKEMYMATYICSYTLAVAAVAIAAMTLRMRNRTRPFTQEVSQILRRNMGMVVASAVFTLLFCGILAAAAASVYRVWSGAVQIATQLPPPPPPPQTAGGNGSGGGGVLAGGGDADGNSGEGSGVHDGAAASPAAEDGGLGLLAFHAVGSGNILLDSISPWVQLVGAAMSYFVVRAAVGLYVSAVVTADYSETARGAEVPSGRCGGCPNDCCCSKTRSCSLSCQTVVCHCGATFYAALETALMLLPRAFLLCVGVGGPRDLDESWCTACCRTVRRFKQHPTLSLNLAGAEGMPFGRGNKLLLKQVQAASTIVGPVFQLSELITLNLSAGIAAGAVLATSVYFRTVQPDVRCPAVVAVGCGTASFFVASVALHAARCTCEALAVAFARDVAAAANPADLSMPDALKALLGMHISQDYAALMVDASSLSAPLAELGGSRGGRPAPPRRRSTAARGTTRVSQYFAPASDASSDDDGPVLTRTVVATAPGRPPPPFSVTDPNRATNGLSSTEEMNRLWAQLDNPYPAAVATSSRRPPPVAPRQGDRVPLVAETSFMARRAGAGGRNHATGGGASSSAHAGAGGGISSAIVAAVSGGGGGGGSAVNRPYERSAWGDDDTDSTTDVSRPPSYHRGDTPPAPAHSMYLDRAAVNGVAFDNVQQNGMLRQSAPRESSGSAWGFEPASASASTASSTTTTASGRNMETNIDRASAGWGFGSAASTLDRNTENTTTNRRRRTRIRSTASSNRSSFTSYEVVDEDHDGGGSEIQAFRRGTAQATQRARRGSEGRGGVGGRAATAGASGGGAGDDAGLCVVCVETRANNLLKPCNHLCICSGCLGHYRHPTGFRFECPICRQGIIDSHEVFLT